VYLTDAEFDLLHERAAVPPEADLVLDVDGLSEQQQIDAIRVAWAKASRRRPHGI
jgi:hypothetical protein